MGVDVRDERDECACRVQRRSLARRNSRSRSRPHPIDVSDRSCDRATRVRRMGTVRNAFVGQNIMGNTFILADKAAAARLRVALATCVDGHRGRGHFLCSSCRQKSAAARLPDTVATESRSGCRQPGVACVVRRLAAIAESATTPASGSPGPARSVFVCGAQQRGAGTYSLLLRVRARRTSKQPELLCQRLSLQRNTHLDRSLVQL